MRNITPTTVPTSLPGGLLAPSATHASSPIESVDKRDLRPLKSGPFGATLQAQTALRHVPSIVSASKKNSRLHPQRELTLAFALPLNNEEELVLLIEDMHNPQHENFGRFLTPKQFQDRYHPTAAQLNHVRTLLFAAGLKPQGNQGIFLEAAGRIKDIEAFLGTEFHSYTSPHGKSFFASSRSIELPESSGIRAVHGVHNASAPRRSAQPLLLDVPTGELPNAAAIRAVYGIPAALNGTGQTLGLIEFGSYNVSDIKTYKTANAIGSYELTNIVIGQNPPISSEATMDIELMMALAPGAKLNVYEFQMGISFASAITSVANPGPGLELATAVSISYGLSEDAISSEDAASENVALMQMVAQGQTLFASSGDTGAYNGESSLNVNDPASQPLAVGVGGTTLRGFGNGTYINETAWSASGGGTSKYWSIPSWQKGSITAASLGSTAMRNVPDVAANADLSAGFSFAFGSGWYIGGGTSMSAPLWAAFAAIAGQERSNNNKSALGFMAPALYDIAQSSSIGSAFYDIADGGTNGHFPAVPGYDLVTGLGSFAGGNLLSNLTNASPVVLSSTGALPTEVSTGNGLTWYTYTITGPSHTRAPAPTPKANAAADHAPLSQNVALGLVCYLGVRALFGR
jgi:kumamolisin